MVETQTLGLSSAFPDTLPRRWTGSGATGTPPMCAGSQHCKLWLNLPASQYWPLDVFNLIDLYFSLEREVQKVIFSLQITAKAEARPGGSWEPGNPFGFLTFLAGAQVLGPSVLPWHVSRELEGK